MEDLLTSMGFSREHVALALAVTGNAGVEPAMEWLLANKDDLDEQVPEGAVGGESLPVNPGKEKSCLKKSSYCIADSSSDSELPDDILLPYQTAQSNNDKFCRSHVDNDNLTSRAPFANLPSKSTTPYFGKANKPSYNISQRAENILSSRITHKPMSQTSYTSYKNDNSQFASPHQHSLSQNTSKRKPNNSQRQPSISQKQLNNFKRNPSTSQSHFSRNPNAPSDQSDISEKLLSLGLPPKVTEVLAEYVNNQQDKSTTAVNNDCDGPLLVPLNTGNKNRGQFMNNPCIKHNKKFKNSKSVPKWHGKSSSTNSKCWPNKHPEVNHSVSANSRQTIRKDPKKQMPVIPPLREPPVTEVIPPLIKPQFTENSCTISHKHEKGVCELLLAMKQFLQVHCEDGGKPNQSTVGTEEPFPKNSKEYQRNKTHESKRCPESEPSCSSGNNSDNKVSKNKKKYVCDNSSVPCTPENSCLEDENSKVNEPEENESIVKVSKIASNNSDGDHGSIKILVRLPDGDTLNGNYQESTMLGTILISIKKKEIFKGKQLELFINLPKRIFTADDNLKTLGELGLTPSAILYARELNDKSTFNGSVVKTAGLSNNDENDKIKKAEMDLNRQKYVQEMKKALEEKELEKYLTLESIQSDSDKRVRKYGSLNTGNPSNDSKTRITIYVSKAVLASSFSYQDRLSVVKDFIAKNSSEKVKTLQFKGKIFSLIDYSRTLVSLGLCPSASIRAILE